MSGLDINTTSVIQTLNVNQTANFIADKGYWLVNSGYNSNTVYASITLIERNTGKQLNQNLYGIMHVDGKKFASVTMTGGYSSSIYVMDDEVDALNLFLLEHLAGVLYSIAITGLTVYATNVYSVMQVLSITTSNQQIFQMPGNDNQPYTLYYTNFGAASGETDTLNIYDIYGNVYQTINITNQQNQKVILPLSWGGETNAISPFVDVIASGVTSPTGKISYTIYRGVS